MRSELRTPADYKIQRWKNGTGSTSQITIEPRVANFPTDPYLWRVSSARVNAAGPFSLFPGYGRILILVEGERLDLSPGGRVPPFEITRFRGEDEISVLRPGQDLIDYNLFWKRDAVESTCEIIERSVKRSLRGETFPEALSIVLTALGGGLSLHSNERAFQAELDPWETLRLDLDPEESARGLDLHLMLETTAGRAILSTFRARQV